MLLNKEELKDFHKKLADNFEGYVQMSDTEAEIFHKKPLWDEMHTQKNFIFEMAMFDGKRSIMIRQINDGFIVIDKDITIVGEKTEELFYAKDGKRVKIIQVWEEKEDSLCENFIVLKPTLQLFAGFEGEAS